VQVLAAEKCKLVVVACNPASSAALLDLRQRYLMSIVGIEPAVKPACALAQRGKVGVLASSGTVLPARCRDLVRRVAGDTEVIDACVEMLKGTSESAGRMVDDAHEELPVTED
jgi:glutamate racemase